MRYIRTKDGKIIDTLNCRKLNGMPLYEIKDGFFKSVDKKDIVKQADTIEELIEDGDLVHDSECDEMFFIDKFTIFDYGAFDELYTKQGRNYVLVWTKEEGVI